MRPMRSFVICGTRVKCLACWYASLPVSGPYLAGITRSCNPHWSSCYGMPCPDLPTRSPPPALGPFEQRNGARASPNLCIDQSFCSVGCVKARSEIRRIDEGASPPLVGFLLGKERAGSIWTRDGLTLSERMLPACTYFCYTSLVACRWPASVFEPSQLDWGAAFRLPRPIPLSSLTPSVVPTLHATPSILRSPAPPTAP